MRGRLMLMAGAIGLLATACSSTTTPAASGSPAVTGQSTGGPATGGPATSPLPVVSPYQPVIDPVNFTGVVDNPWFPLKPGSTYVYTGTKDGEPVRDVFVVSHETKVVDGVPCVVVLDKLYLSGKLAENTSDYYTQDRQGNVWYFGEATEELDDTGKITSTEGSWLAGQDGALPGVYMQANPAIGRAFRQEYSPGQAEDQFRAVSLSSSIQVPYGSFANALLTEEWTVLEPDVLDHKYYVKGIGQVAELSVKGGTEKAELVSYTAG
jgi:hypothetical protein